MFQNKMNELHKKKYVQGVNFSDKTYYDELIVLPKCLNSNAPFTKQ